MKVYVLQVVKGPIIGVYKTRAGADKELEGYREDGAYGVAMGWVQEPALDEFEVTEYELED